MRIKYTGSVKEKLFKIISNTAVVANTIGFVSNYFLFGMGLPTIVCLCCALTIIIITIVGKFMKKFDVATAFILLLVNLGEFPYLYYVYGNSTIVYMILGFVGAIVCSDKKNRWKYACILSALDITVMYLGFTFNKESWRKLKTESVMGATFCSFVIVMFALVFNNLTKSEIEKKLAVIEEKFEDFSMKRKNKKFTFSGGAGFYNKEDAITKIYEKVNEKLYETKNMGKNIVVWS